MRKNVALMLLACWVTLGSAGCARRDVSVAAIGAAPASPAAFVAPPEVRQADIDTQRPQLSYEHTLQVALPMAQIKPAYQGLVDACRKLGERYCVNLKSSLDGGDSWLHASLRLKVRRADVGALRDQAAGLGEVIKQETEAEDLGGAIVDVKQRLAMKVALRDELLNLRTRSRDNIDALLKVTEKLAEVQADIEQASGEQAGYQDRLDMDRLNIELRSQGPQTSSIEKLGHALRSFGTDFIDGFAALISFVALTLPWLALLLFLPLLLRVMRLVWRWTRRIA